MDNTVTPSVSQVSRIFCGKLPYSRMLSNRLQTKGRVLIDFLIASLNRHVFGCIKVHSCRRHLIEQGHLDPSDRKIAEACHAGRNTVAKAFVYTWKQLVTACQYLMAGNVLAAIDILLSGNAPQLQVMKHIRKLLGRVAQVVCIKSIRPANELAPIFISQPATFCAADRLPPGAQRKDQALRVPPTSAVLTPGPVPGGSSAKSHDMSGCESKGVEQKISTVVQDLVRGDWFRGLFKRRCRDG